ncbi:MAG: orotidine-5'-phosphate decarboxylase [Acidobacteria bacterium]|nr:orotidine-5'-phosphate decarboxylase [Acidobacteriota bacterium]
MDQLLVAVDVDTSEQALEICDLLRGTVGGFKIGSRLFTSEGPSLVSTLVSHGDRVFLDLKYHDIPTVVAEAVQAASRLGAWMLTVHAAGGLRMMQAAAEAARKAENSPLVVGVTVLTSLDNTELDRIGIPRTVGSQVGALAQLAHKAKLDGVVASPQEVEQLRTQLGREFTIVTPGIRPRKNETRTKDDQVRTLGPAEALGAGSNYLVVGRPIIASPDPLKAARDIVSELETVRRVV